MPRAEWLDAGKWTQAVIPLEANNSSTEHRKGRVTALATFALCAAIQRLATMLGSCSPLFAH